MYWGVERELKDRPIIMIDNLLIRILSVSFNAGDTGIMVGMFITYRDLKGNSGITYVSVDITKQVIEQIKNAINIQCRG